MRTAGPALVIAVLLAAGACDDHKHARPPRVAKVDSTVPGVSQGVIVSNSVSADKYVERVMTEELGAFPQIGWLTPPHNVIVEGAPVDAVFLGSRGFAKLTNLTALSKAETDSVRRAHHVACDAETATSFEAPFEVSKPERVLVAAKPFRDAVVSGLEHPPLTPAQVATGRALLELGDSVRWRDTTFALAPTGGFFGVHTAYEQSTGRMLRTVLYYVNATGIVSARRIQDGKDYQGGSIVRVFRLPGFATPVLLVDKSTSDTQALSLIAVAPDGQFSEGRAYEYVANCGSSRP
jgi:hypothetical protein